LKWLAKVFLQKTLSYIPRSEWWNYICQRHLTKSFGNVRNEFLKMIERVLIHFDYFTEYSINKITSEALFYEFGAGWHLTMPIGYYYLGINNQTIIDIRPNIRFDIINQILPLFHILRTEIEAKTGRKIRDVEHFEVNSLFDLKNMFGINYLAPCDAANTGLLSESFDFISNNFVMEHLPKKILPAILKECWRILKPRGIMSCFIDMNDHYSYFDTSISRYNFLKFNEKLWDWVNSSVHYQNRLRYPDYLEMFERAGFVVEAENIRWPNAIDLNNLERINVAPEFRMYPQKILGITSLKIVLRKP
jgi:predicted SAM-dependent methyltransferase